MSIDLYAVGPRLALLWIVLGLAILAQLYIWLYARRHKLPSAGFLRDRMYFLLAVVLVCTAIIIWKG